MDIGSRAKNVKDLFHALLERPRELRAAELASACGPDHLLQREVQQLLDADDSGSTFLDRPAYSAGGSEQPTFQFSEGQLVGGFQIVRLLGTGGMGDIYEAIQPQPRRTVALKFLRSAHVSPSARRRFLAEADVLARLAHPAIAQVYATGVYDAGILSIPYFAMEYVAGANDILQFARLRALDTRARLLLFLEVCAAVEHGHQRGVIHRDLKPGNVLVGENGRLKVIDFGIAKAQDCGLPGTLATDAGQLIGTLQYMSPEQLTRNSASVDTRSDIYSLGLILYELLAARKPYELSQMGLPDAMAQLRANEIPPLCKFRCDLRGDLSTIVAKATARERERRYASVGEFSADLERFLRNEPISARPANMLYVLRKLAIRHRTAAIVIAVSAAAVLAGASIATWKAIEATRERKVANLATRRAERINGFLLRILSAADPRTTPADTTIRQALDRAATAMDEELHDDDAVAADVHHMIGSMYEQICEHNRAEMHLRAELEIRRRTESHDGKLAENLRDLAWVLTHRAPSEAEQLFREAASVFHDRDGPKSVDVIQAGVSIAMLRSNAQCFEEAELLTRDALARLKQIGREQGGTALLAHRTLAAALFGRHNSAEAELHYREAVRLARIVYGDQHKETAATLSAFADFLHALGRMDEAGSVRGEAEMIRHRLESKASKPE